MTSDAAIDDQFYDDPDIVCAAACLFREGFKDEAVAMRSFFGGTRVYISKRPSATDLLVKVIGMDAAIALARELGGIMVYVSRGVDIPGQIRKQHVALFSLARVPARLVAMMLGINERSVHRIRTELRKKGMSLPQQAGGQGRTFFFNRKVQ